ncbi:hypothetical protein FF36_00354 [Frankia torreyi]|uniref:Uncharacterized protein n=1 Tax=Frankia torreyi TaxID=1856 RepID=A0A0D8BM79_9ACTN|nr:hypothetical protein FF36_00354 [Frankia torreyi]KQM07963.1 hypothetical protein FF86_1001219 [Frankia sp. CpI1-P]
MNGREVRQFVWQVVPAAVLAILVATDTTVSLLTMPSAPAASMTVPPSCCSVSEEA